MQIYIRVDWTQCTDLFQSAAFISSSHTVRTSEEVPIGCSYMIPLELAATGGLTGDAYRPLEGPETVPGAVSCYDGAAFAPLSH